jgi:cell division septum initiation protein DivIVA
MSSQNASNNIDPDGNRFDPLAADTASELGGAVLLQELNRLEEMILSSPHIPLTRRTLVDEEQLLDQLDHLRMRLPVALQEAQAIVEQKQEILFLAEQQAEKIIQAAQAKAAEILSETAIMQQAELAAKQLQQQVEQDCLALQEQNLLEIHQLRQQVQQELDQTRQKAIAEAQEIQQGADDYADAVLGNLEQQLQEMLRIIENGRQHLNTDVPPK